jgi:hypothetical protein
MDVITMICRFAVLGDNKVFYFLKILPHLLTRGIGVEAKPRPQFNKATLGRTATKKLSKNSGFSGTAERR